MISAGIVQATKTDAAAKKTALALKNVKLKKAPDKKAKAAKRATGPDTFTTKAKPKAPERPQLACRGVLCRPVARGAAAARVKPSTWDIARETQSIQHIGWSTDGSLTIATQHLLASDSTHKKLSIKSKNGRIFYKRKTDKTWKAFKTTAPESVLSEEQKAVLKIYERGAKFAKKMRWMIKSGFSGSKLPVGFSIQRDGTVAYDRVRDSDQLRHRLISTMTAHRTSKTVTFKVNHHAVVDGISVSFPATFTFRAGDLRNTSRRAADRGLYALGISHAAKYRSGSPRTNASRIGVAGKNARRR